MDQVQVGLSPEVRARLAQKGRILYGKFCGTGGRGICAESFALHHIWRGEGVEGVRIPMLGIADSLNVSVSAAILAYEARRQRG